MQLQILNKEGNVEYCVNKKYSKDTVSAQFGVSSIRWNLLYEFMSCRVFENASNSNLIQDVGYVFILLLKSLLLCILFFVLNYNNLLVEDIQADPTKWYNLSSADLNTLYIWKGRLCLKLLLFSLS